MLRLSWTQPEDLVPHGIRAARLDGIDVDDLAQTWVAAGGSLTAPASGATPDPAPAKLGELGRTILSRLDERPAPEALRRAEPDGLDEILALARPVAPRPAGGDLGDRIHGAWLGRAAGCLLGKPVEKIPREGIREIARDTGNWPVSGYFTGIGLAPAIAARYPWNRRSAPTSLAENIDGMPEDDDLNFALVALDLLERHGEAVTTGDVALSWLANLPGGRVFTAERITYRNLLDGYEPEVAGSVHNPFRDWIGAQIRADVYGWAHPGDPVAAARLAWTDARLTHGRNGRYGAMFAAAACSAAVVATGVADVLASGLSVVPPGSRFAAAVELGAELGAGPLSTEDALDAIHERYGDLHWVHVLNNAAVLAFALVRGDGDYAATITTAVTGGWDTDSTGATAGSLAGALTGAAALPGSWTGPLRNRLASTVPGFDGIGFDALAARTVVLARSARPADADEANTNEPDPLVPRPIDLPTTLPLAGRIDPVDGDIAKIFAAPDDPADRPAWRAALAGWRADARARLGYDGSVYERPDTAWTRSCYSVALVWLWDERLFDRSRLRFDVDAFLARTEDHGGFDGVVLWHAYPVIGIDDRNQFDFYRDVPGLRDLVAAFQARGVRVFLDYNPWDTGTRRPEHDDATGLALLAGELGSDGMFLDTMKEGDAALVAALLDAGQVLEGESRVPNERIADHQLSWAQWFADSAAPGVQRARWFERRHMTHSTRRWNRDHGDELQSAFMNGTGMLVWDAVFGVWVGWHERDKATLRRMLRVQRACTVLFEGDWTPLVDTTPEAAVAGVYASRFADGDRTLWTIVNRAGTDYTGEVPVAAGGTWFDLTAGVRLGDDHRITVPARGVAAVLAVTGAEPEWLAGLLAAAAADPGATGTDFPARTATRVDPAPSTGRPGPAVRVAGGTRTLPMTYRRRETGTYQGAPYVEEWKPLPPRLHDQRQEPLTVTLSTVDVAVTEVTNAEFASFLAATGYRPLCANRFAPDEAVGAAAGGPVTMVGLDDARAYAAWAGARLPTEFEWQAAAAEPGFGRATPLVWNWTESEHTDGVTRFVMLKGGSDHESHGSQWYVDGGPRDPSFSLKFLLPGLGADRSPSIGFRLAWEV